VVWHGLINREGGLKLSEKGRLIEGNCSKTTNYGGEIGKFSEKFGLLTPFGAQSACNFGSNLSNSRVLHAFQRFSQLTDLGESSHG
jgi:hypothetical protein